MHVTREEIWRKTWSEDAVADELPKIWVHGQNKDRPMNPGRQSTINERTNPNRPPNAERKKHEQEEPRARTKNGQTRSIEPPQIRNRSNHALSRFHWKLRIKNIKDLWTHVRELRLLALLHRELRCKVSRSFKSQSQRTRKRPWIPLMSKSHDQEPEPSWLGIILQSII